MQDAEKRVGVTTDLSYVICIRYGSLHARLSSVTKSRRPSIYRRGGPFFSAPSIHRIGRPGSAMQNSRRAVPPRNLAAYLLRGALSATKGQAYLLETPPRDKGPGDLTGATQLVKESDSRPRRTFYTPPPLVSNRDETEACRPRPDAITRTPRAESRNFSIL